MRGTIWGQKYQRNHTRKDIILLLKIHIHGVAPWFIMVPPSLGITPVHDSGVPLGTDGRLIVGSAPDPS